jgi:hypothetical protein
MENIALIGIDLVKTLPYSLPDRRGGCLPSKFTRPKLIEFLRHAPLQPSQWNCGGSHFMARKLEELGHFPKLISPQFVRPFVKSNKNDFVDAEAILKLHRVRLCVLCSPERNLSRQCGLCIVSVNPWFRIR